MSNEDEIISECIRIFSKPYEHARSSALDAETETLEREWKAMVNFRDALDHTARVFNAIEESDYEEAKDQLSDVESHLHRVSYETPQAIAEAHLDEVRKNRLPSLVYKITGYEAPSRSDHVKDVAVIKEAIKTGRKNKGNDWRKATAHFNEAKDRAIELNERTPPRNSVYFRLGTIVFGIFTIVGTLNAI